MHVWLGPHRSRTTDVPQGLPYGLLVHDMVERFLLHFFTQSAHTNTRGTFSTPESTTLDRDGYDYASRRREIRIADH